MPAYDELLPQREEVAYFMRRLYRQGLTTCSGGNISLRVDDGIVLITPSKVDKGELKAEEIAMFTLEGENLTPRLVGSIETGMHLEVLRRRKDVCAIVHAHPVTATAFTAMDKPIDFHLTAESYSILHKPKLAPYCIMGSDGLAKIVAESLRDANVALMKNHGVIAVGASLLQAFDRLEVMEAAARMTWIVHTMQALAPLDAEQLAEIDRLKKR